MGLTHQGFPFGKIPWGGEGGQIAENCMKTKEFPKIAEKCRKTKEFPKIAEKCLKTPIESRDN